MKRTIFSLIFFLFTGAPLAAQVVFDTCVVTGTLYNQNGAVEDSIKVEVVRTVARGTTRPIIIQTKRTFYTDANGLITMTLLKNSDVTFRSNAYGLDNKTLTIPDAATASLESLVPAATVPTLYAVAVPNLTIVDSSGGSYSTDSLRIAAGLAAITPTGGSGTPTIISTATGSGAAYGDSIKVAYDQIGGKGDSDSLSTAYAAAAAALPKSDTAALHAQLFAVLNDKDAGYADGDSVSLQIKAVKDLIGGKGDSDSLSTAYGTAAAALPKADTTALHAQKFAVLNDQIAGLADGDSVSVQVKLIKDLLGAKGDSDSLSTAYSTASAALPLASLDDSLDALTTGGPRSVSSNGRIVSLQDSVTLTVAPNETINLATGNNFRLTLTANDTLGFTGGIDGQVIQVVVTNAGTHTLDWSGVAWPDGTAPTLTAVANKRSIFSFLVSGGMVYGVSVLNY